MRTSGWFWLFLTGLVCGIWCAITAHEVYDTYWATAFWILCCLSNLRGALKEILEANS